MQGSPHDRLLAYRVAQLEDSHKLLAESLQGINEAFISFKAWGKAAIFVVGFIHPILVGIIIKLITEAR